MELISQQSVLCPYCGESIEVLIDHEDAGQQYIEDCEVCCKPITFSIDAGFDGELSVSVHDENETF